jgi:uncharacterized protein
MNRLPKRYISFFLLIISIWLWYMLSNNGFELYKTNWMAALTMLFGSFIAGSSPEGSASIAYPVFTLLLKIEPSVARNFAFAIQSIGMTSASLLILGLRVKVEWNYIKYVTLGGLFGLVIGTYYVVPLISPVMAKLFFVSLWLSFGLILWYENLSKKREVFDSIQEFDKNDQIRLIIFGFIGGIISSIFGTGINIFTYCLMTIYYKINEKVATPSSVIIMTIETIFGFLFHLAILKDFSNTSFELWLVCIPIVIIFAPLGAFVITKLPRLMVARILYMILVVQFIGAMLVIRPNLYQIFLCIITILCGLSLFLYLAKLKR